MVPGDLVKVLDKEEFPADLLLLTSSEDSGECKVQTSNLDGEISLKTKQALEFTKMHFVDDILDDKHLDLSVSVNLPCYGLSVFKGSITIQTQHFVDSKQLLLRGSNLKNTHFIVGMVVYTGHKTKLMMNQRPTPFKRSQFENILNKIVVFQLVIQTGLCLFLAISSVSFENDKNSKIYTYEIYDSNWMQGVTTYFSFFLLLNSLIPISMIVSLELVKFLQTFFVQWDLKMYCKEQNKPANVQSMSIIEELGAIDYIFCDKTGTLTANIMKFKGCNIGGVVYMDPFIGVEARDVHEDSSKNIFTQRHDNCNTLQDIINEMSLSEENLLSFNFEVGGISFKTQADLIYEFWLAIVLCNDIVTDKSQQKTAYLSSSPDEVALIEAAREFNFEFLERSSSSIKISIYGTIHTFEILAINNFTSERKRMSVLIKDTAKNQLKLFIKGADEALMKICDYSLENPFMDKINDSLRSFAEQGLRSLHVGFKVIENADDWLFRYNQTKCSHSEDQSQRLDDLAAEIEDSIVILGITAVEDRLQKSVPKAIKEFNEAGVHVWMITGDKLETAENIAYSCSLLERKWNIYIVKYGDDIPGVLNKIKQEIATNESNKANNSVGLIIEGDALAIAIEKERETFYKLCKVAKGVVCCRANPKQKARVVNFIRKMNPQAKTLAIGDGGNDITMIQTAHVGVGIYGKEGHQAANSADFSIGEFRFLRHLMFVHGRWNSRRIGFFILYFFFKNLAFTLVQGYFAFISGFSAQTVWDDWYLLLFNSAITAAGITAYSLWEQDLNYRTNPVVKKFWPLLYSCNRENLPLTIGKYFFFMAWGIGSSVIVFFICGKSFNEILNQEGKTETFWDYSTCMYSSIVIIVAIVLVIKMKYWSWLQHLVIWVLGFALYCPLFMLIYDQVPGTYVYSNTKDFLALPVFWFTLVLCVGICTIPYYAGCLYFELFHPLISDMVFQGRIVIDKPVHDELNQSEKLDTLHSTNNTKKFRSLENRK